LLSKATFHGEDEFKYWAQASRSNAGVHVYIDYDHTGDGVAGWRILTNEPPRRGRYDASVITKYDRSDKTHSQWYAKLMERADWGFHKIFDATGVLKKMSATLDRHSNWYSTFTYMDLSDKYQFTTGAPDSPWVATSYYVDKSDYFTSARKYENGQDIADQSGKRWMIYLMRTHKRNWLHINKLRNGQTIDWEATYMDESTLSNDFFTEKAWNKFAYIPENDFHALLYMPDMKKKSNVAGGAPAPQPAPEPKEEEESGWKWPWSGW
jgi:hypothetical protein